LIEVAGKAGNPDDFELGEADVDFVADALL